MPKPVRTNSGEIEIVVWIDNHKLERLTYKTGPALTKKIESALRRFGKVRACWVHERLQKQ